MQQAKHECLPKMLSPRVRLCLGLLTGAVVFLFLAGAISIPFYFESSTILYKFGLDRLLLRSGQVVGLVAGCLLLLQIILGARLKCLDRIYSLNNLFKFHRMIGIIIAGLVIIHPVLVFIPENRLFIPLQLRYWPEFVGLFLLLVIVFTVISSYWRISLKFSFHRWWPIHRATAILIIIAFWIHLMFVSDTFSQSLPKLLAFCVMGLCGLLLLWIRTRGLRNQRKSFTISEIEPAGEDAVCLKVTSKTNPMPGHIPGQFGFITPFSPHISKEEHPFTIASSPTNNSFLEFVIRTTGDWTRKLKDLQPGDRVSLSGPFGLFSHLGLSGDKEIIMIAGGIGITPMLSMLRYMADRDDQRKITLIWSNRTVKHIIFQNEFKDLEAQLKGLRIFHILTRDPGSFGETGRLDRRKLNSLASDCGPSAAVFICGPDQMMEEIYHAMVSLGFPKSLIFTERFSL